MPACRCGIRSQRIVPVCRNPCMPRSAAHGRNARCADAPGAPCTAGGHGAPLPVGASTVRRFPLQARADPGNSPRAGGSTVILERIIRLRRETLCQDRLALLKLLRSDTLCSVDLFRLDGVGLLLRRTVQTRLPGLYCTAVTRPQVERSTSLMWKSQKLSIACTLQPSSRLCQSEACETARGRLTRSESPIDGAAL